MSLRRRFWTELGLSVVALLSAVVTMLWKDWIEVAFGVDPDGHSGGTEWTFAATSFVVATAAALAARYEYRRTRFAA